jgi:hypothetical protein
MWDVSSTGSVSMLPYRMEVPGGAERIFDSHSGVVVSRRLGAVVIMAPLSRTALGSSGDVWTSWTTVWARAGGCCGSKGGEGVPSRGRYGGLSWGGNGWVGLGP